MLKVWRVKFTQVLRFEFLFSNFAGQENSSESFEARTRADSFVKLVSAIERF